MTKFKVIYHANCNDGFCSAYLLWNELPKNTEYIPMHYTSEFDTSDCDQDTVLYIVDFSFKKEVMIYLASLVKEIWVFDHHKTAQKEFENLDVPNIHATFNMEKSGAQLTWEFLYKNNFYDPLVAYTADRDLWKFSLVSSKEVNAYIATIPYDFEAWEDLEINLEQSFGTCVSAGKAILMFQQKQIDSAVRNAVECKCAQIPGITFLAVNSTVNFSEVAGELAKDRFFGVAWFQRSDGKFQYSLRSDPNGLDVSDVAKLFGGGGHKHAAGFESNTQVLVRI